MRMLALVVALAIVYIWRRRTQDSTVGRPTPASLWVFTLACLLLLWADLVVFDWVIFWHLNFLENVPLGACAVGAFLGYMLADQRLASESITPGEDGLPASTDLAARVSQMSKALTANLALAVLVVAAVVPPRTWSGMLERVQGVEAGALKFTLAAVQSADTARAIQNAAPPRSPVDTYVASGAIERTGFIPERLGMMKSYTYPPISSDGSPLNSPFKTPEAYILSDVEEPSLSTRSHSHEVRQIQRDRAIAWKVAGLQPGTLASDQLQWIEKLGNKQEQFLSRLAPHVECLDHFVMMTKERHLLQYQNSGIVEDLFAIAHLWSATEKAFALQEQETAAILMPAYVRQVELSPYRTALKAALLVNDFRNQDREALVNAALSKKIVTISSRLKDFNRQANEFLDFWTKDSILAGSGTNSQINRVSAQCAGTESSHETEGDTLESLAYDLGSQSVVTLREGGFTPYLTIFVAQALSAMGDHASAIELLVQWMSDLTEIEAHAKEPSKTQHQYIADWYRLQVFTATLTLQKYSEGSDISIPQTREGLRALTTQYFPKILRDISEPPDLRAWRDSSNLQCDEVEHVWKQPIILSFATWIKQYLDFVVRAGLGSATLDKEDLQFVSLLEEIKVECFPNAFSGKLVDAHFSQAEQHLQFITTTTAVHICIITTCQKNQTTEERLSLRQHAEIFLRSAINAFEQAQNDKKLMDKFRDLVYGYPGNDIVLNARRLQKHLEELSQIP